jgi:hypothetical protein
MGHVLLDPSTLAPWSFWGCTGFVVAHFFDSEVAGFGKRFGCFICSYNILIAILWSVSEQGTRKIEWIHGYFILWQKPHFQTQPKMSIGDKLSH